MPEVDVTGLVKKAHGKGKTTNSIVSGAIGLVIVNAIKEKFGITITPEEAAIIGPAVGVFFGVVAKFWRKWRGED